MSTFVHFVSEASEGYGQRGKYLHCFEVLGAAISATDPKTAGSKGTASAVTTFFYGVHHLKAFGLVTLVPSFVVEHLGAVHRGTFLGSGADTANNPDAIPVSSSTISPGARAALPHVAH